MSASLGNVGPAAAGQSSQHAIGEDVLSAAAVDFRQVLVDTSAQCLRIVLQKYPQTGGFIVRTIHRKGREPRTELNIGAREVWASIREQVLFFCWNCSRPGKCVVMWVFFQKVLGVLFVGFFVQWLAVKPTCILSATGALGWFCCCCCGSMSFPWFPPFIIPNSDQRSPTSSPPRLGPSGRPSVAKIAGV